MWRHGPCVCDHVESLPHLHLVPEPSALEDDDILRRIDAWEAGIVKRPEDYEWCSFAAKRKSNENEDENLKDNLL